MAKIQAEVNFNPRPREEGDTQTQHKQQAHIYFNPHPREEGDGEYVAKIQAEVNFNPRPREEGDVCFCDAVGTVEISIHALVKRATANLYNDYLYFEAKYHISDIFHQ